MEPSRGLYGDFEDGILRGRAFGEIGGLICPIRIQIWMFPKIVGFPPKIIHFK